MLAANRRPLQGRLPGHSVRARQQKQSGGDLEDKRCLGPHQAGGIVRSRACARQGVSRPQFTFSARSLLGGANGRAIRRRSYHDHKKRLDNITVS